MELAPLFESSIGGSTEVEAIKADLDALQSEAASGLGRLQVQERGRQLGEREEPPAQESSLEYKLAVIHSSGDVPEDDPLVAAFATALDSLEAKCPEDRQRLADMGVRTQQMLTTDGVNESLLEVFQH